MYKYLIFDLLRSLTVEEKNKLSDFIRSPYFNKSRKITRLYEEVIKYYPLFTSEELTKENLSRIIKPGSKYNDSTMREVIHDLLILVLKFIVQEKFNNMKYVQFDYMLKELTFRNQKRLFNKNFKKIEYDLEKKDRINVEYFQNRYLLESNKFNFELLNTNKKIKANEDLNKFLEGVSNIIIFFITEILNDYIILNIEGNKFNIEYKDNFLCKFIENLNLNIIIQYFPKNNKHVFMLKIYYAMYTAYRYFDKESYYYKYKNILLRYSCKISSDEKTEHFTNLINYCILKNNSEMNRKKFSLELIKLYEIILNNKYYITDKVNHLQSNLFRDILFLGLRIKERGWVLNYIKVYSKNLHPDDKDNMLNFGYAYLYNAEGDYERSLDYINKVSLDYFRYQIDMYNLKIKNFYELDCPDQIFSLIQTYKGVLNSSNLFSKETKMLHHNFRYYIEKITKYKSGEKKIDIGFIKEKIKDCDQVLFKEWLLEKIEETERVVVKVV